MGGVVGRASNNSTIERCVAHMVFLQFGGATGIAGRDLAPSIGIIVGILDRSNMHHVGQMGSEIHRGNLGTYRWGLFNMNSVNQARYVGRGPWGSYGRRAGTVSILSEQIVLTN